MELEKAEANETKTRLEGVLVKIPASAGKNGKLFGVWSKPFFSERSFSYFL